MLYMLKKPTTIVLLSPVVPFLTAGGIHRVPAVPPTAAAERGTIYEPRHTADTAGTPVLVATRPPRDATHRGYTSRSHLRLIHWKVPTLPRNADIVSLLA